LNGNQIQNGYGGDDVLEMRNNIIIVQAPGNCIKMQGYFIESDSVYWGISGAGLLSTQNYPGGGWNLSSVNTNLDRQSVNQSPNINSTTCEISGVPCHDKGFDLPDIMDIDLDRLGIIGGRDIGARECGN
jgi:hypothetical protein